MRFAASVRNRVRTSPKHSREAATVDSRGRQPTVLVGNANLSRAAAAASRLLSPLRGLCVLASFVRGLTPTANGCRRFATQQQNTEKSQTLFRNLAATIVGWLIVAVPLRADEPVPTGREIPAEQRLHRVTWVDATSKQRTSSGRVLLEAQDGGLLFETRDARLWNITPKQLREHEVTREKFEPLTSAELGEQLAREVSEFGISTPTQVVVTKHYVVCSTAGLVYAEWCGATLERLHEAFRSYWKSAGLELRDAEFPLPAVVLKDRSEFAEFAAKHDRPDAAQSPGYFSEPTNRIVLFDLTAGPNSTPAKTAGDIRRKIEAAPFNLATMVHEATHQLAFNSGMHTRYADNPRWLTEGMAMFFEVPDLDSRTGWKTVGRVNAPRLRDYRETTRQPRTTVSLSELIQSDSGFLNPNQAKGAYSSSWGLTFFLLKTRPAETVAYLQTIAKKPRLIADSPADRLRDFECAFGELDALEPEWRKWLKRQGK